MNIHVAEHHCGKIRGGEAALRCGTLTIGNKWSGADRFLSVGDCPHEVDICGIGMFCGCACV